MTTESNPFDLATPTIPPRSRLAHLEPVGVGTSEIECLTSYISRVAIAHRVSMYALFKHVLRPIIIQNPVMTKQFLLTNMYGRTLNGMGIGAEESVRSLQTLTMRGDLRFLTMLPWSDVLPTVNLINLEKRWCPCCFEERRVADQVVYEPLLWALKAVEICPTHRRRLCAKCPHCDQTQPWLIRRSRPGYCYQCGQWLGRSLTDAEVEATQCQPDSEYQTWVAESIGEMLVAAPQLVSPPTRGKYAKTMPRCVDMATGGNMEAFATRVQITRSQLHYWLRGVQPQLSKVCQVCNRLKLRPVDYLTGKIDVVDFTSDATAHARKHKRGAARKKYDLRQDWTAIGEELKQALENEDTPPPVRELARRWDTFSARLYARFPVTCRAITSRRRADKNEREAQALRAALDETPPPSLQVMSRRLGFTCPADLRKRHHQLCEIISERSKAYLKEQKAERSLREHAEVRRIAIEFHREGLFPSAPDVAMRMSKPNRMCREDNRQVLHEMQRELGYR